MAEIACRARHAAPVAAIDRDFGHRSSHETRLAELYIVTAAARYAHGLGVGDLDGDGVQALLHEALGLPRLVQHLEPDFVLSVWATDGRSPAARVGRG